MGARSGTLIVTFAVLFSAAPYAHAALKPTVTLTEAQVKGATPQCAADQVLVEGDYCPEVAQRCMRWRDPHAVVKLQCEEFAPSSRCFGKTIHQKFCIDRYEWPNKKGATPWVAVDWYQAQNHCYEAGKRLCIDREWALACEGQERLPYPYGHTRNNDACNMDMRWRTVDFEAYADPKHRMEEIKKLDQRETAGARPSCLSPFGVYDMAGNVDEWVINERGKPFKSALKGGYWGPVRARCRPMTIIHEEVFHFYQVGFRCCGDVPGVKRPPKVKGVTVRHWAAPEPSRESERSPKGSGR